MSCSACRCAIAEDEDYRRCTLRDCNKMYHVPCTGSINPSSEEREAWICPECCCTSKKGGDNSLTPVGASKKARDPNITIRKKIPPSCVEKRQCDESTDLSNDIRSLKSEMATLREQLARAISLITGYEPKLDNYALQVTTLTTKLENYETRVSDKAPVSQGSPVYTSTTKIARHANHSHKTGQNQQARPVLSSDSSAIRGSAATVEKEGINNGNKSARMQHIELVKSHDATVPNNQQWTEVKKRKSRGPESLCGAAGPAITTLRAVEPVKHLHLWNMESSADDVLQYLKHLCPTGSCSVEELTPKGNYKSYKLGVPEAHYETCYSVDVWPINARIKQWVNYRKPVGELARVNVAGTTSSNQQPFRSASGA